jgi:hypothetical protein
VGLSVQEAKISDSTSLGASLTDTGGALVDWAGSGLMGSLLVPNPSPSVFSMVSGPSNICSDLEYKNGLKIVSFPVVEPFPLSCCPSNKVRGYLGKASSELMLKWLYTTALPRGFRMMVPKISFPACLRVLLPVPRRRKQVLVRKWAIKVRRNLADYFVRLIMRLIAEALQVVGVEGGCTKV